MKKKLLSLCCIIGFAAANAQIVPGQFLDLNNIKARVNADGSLFTNYTNAQFEAPKGSGKNTIFADNLWIGGFDAGNQLKMAAQTYRQTGTDFFPGPLNSLGQADTSAAWNQVWKLNKCDIDAFHVWVLSGAPGPLPIDSFALNEIVTWPTIGNEGQRLAPYFDYNGDNFYDPYVGDYPLIKGDQAIYFVYNDKGGIHTETGGAAIGVEIQGMAYVFNCPDSALYNTVFVNYKITNKSSNALNHAYIGKWTDFDIGTYSDDYIGSDVTRGAYYAYNGAVNDATYGANPPAQAAVFLRGPYADADGMADPADSTVNGTGYGDAVVDNERLGMSKFIAYNNSSSASVGNPTTAAQYYDYLTGTWRDGGTLTYGGTGYGIGCSCDYMYPGDSDPTGAGINCGTIQAPWSEWMAGNTPGDRRGVGASGPFTFNPGAVEEVDMAYIFAKATSGGNLASVTTMQERIDSVRSQFNRGMSTCGCNLIVTGIQNNSTPDAELSVYPNPATNMISIGYKSPSKNVIVGIYDVTGQLVKQEIMNFSSAQTMDVSNLVTGLYLLKIQDGKNISSKKFLKQ
ncbi:MAG: hypothetical protein JWP12_3088 [Bacteroidetes bacterium]|nr:hypothetical protein [Bacteroidota bacterium]